MNELLRLLENDARLSPEALALMLDKEVGDIKKMIEDTSVTVSFSATTPRSTGTRPITNTFAP